MISHFREIKCQVSALHNNYDFLENVLRTRPKAKIVHILTHDERQGFSPVFDENQEHFIDEFGYPVYLGKELDWEGDMTDIDERYESPLPF